MKSRREFVISQGWGTSSGLRALARIHVLGHVEKCQAGGPLVDVETDGSLKNEANTTRESASRS
jgi:hypothetical protein